MLCLTEDLKQIKVLQCRVENYCFSRTCLQECVEIQNVNVNNVCRPTNLKHMDLLDNKNRKLTN